MKLPMESISRTWGTDAGERQLSFPCDGLISGADESAFRGVTINASSETVFRWLCQLRVAPYSYDWIDNGGRQSPHQLLEGLDEIEIGQTVMRIFDLIDFKRNEHFTIRMKQKSTSATIFGDIVVSYLIVPRSPQSCRLLAKLVIKYSGGLTGQIMRSLLPWGDLIMMRRQLLNLKQLSEGSI